MTNDTAVERDEELIEGCVAATFAQFALEKGTIPDPYAAARICIQMTREYDAALASGEGGEDASYLRGLIPFLEAHHVDVARLNRIADRLSLGQR